MSDLTAIHELHQAVRNRNLTLYLAAGVSVASGVPDWRKLVLMMYYRALADLHQIEGWRAYPNYLYSTAEWYLERNPDAAEIVAQKIRTYYPSDEAFQACLWQTMYAPFVDPESNKTVRIDVTKLRRRNQTIDAVARLCEQNLNSERGIRAVVTYNFDDLLETVLQQSGVRHQSISTAAATRKAKVLPIYHVHGYVPLKGTPCSLMDLVFSEEQYHAVAHNPYSWSNIVQIKYMTDSVGLAVGVSLTDRNMRRLLDALSRAPIHFRLHALLQRPQWAVSEEDIQAIQRSAMAVEEMFSDSGFKRREGREDMIRLLITRAKSFDQKQHVALLKRMRVEPIWYDDHEEIPGIISRIIG